MMSRFFGINVFVETCCSVEIEILWSDGTTLYEIYTRESGSEKAILYANSVHVLQ